MDKVEELIQKGVNIPHPASVDVGDDVDISRISGHGVDIRAGCRLTGPRLAICDGAQIGMEGPATVDNCFVGPRVKLKAGFFSKAAFLENSSCGSGSHVREGTILEEEASIAHTVGLKQTILFPYVTLGSLINFCDCLMTGGSSRQNHSEVGSSYIHFNFTPNQDKATPSLIGDVPRGVMLDQAPVFLGGQGGLVGPCRIAFGTILAAGTICRKDQLQENRLVFEAPSASGSIPVDSGVYRNLNRLIGHNIHYLGNLWALWQWYVEVRSRFTGPSFPEVLLDGLLLTLQSGIDERIKQLERLQNKFKSVPEAAGSPNLILQKAFRDRWSDIKHVLSEKRSFDGLAQQRDQFLSGLEKGIGALGRSYLNVIHNLSSVEKAAGSEWLAGIVSEVENGVAKVLPEWKLQRRRHDNRQ